MEIKQVGEETMHLEPKTEDESALVQMLFEEVTHTWPDLPMGDRSDFAMRTFAVVKKWAHENGDTKTIGGEEDGK